MPTANWFPGVAFLIASTVALLAEVGAQQPNGRTGSTVWDGVYSPAQAERGKATYVRHCGRCHGEDLANPRNPLAGERFAEHWEARTLADLFRRIRDTMPAGGVDTVQEPEKLDTMAYVLQQNGFPEGRADLTTDADALAAIQITGKGGPAPPRTGTLVRAIGCLDPLDDREWQLTNATEPQRATLEAASPPSPAASPSTEAGSRTIVLLNPFPGPAAHRGHRMAATGFLVRRPDGDAINVVSLEMLAPTCAR